MKDNLNVTGGLLLSEAVMMALAPSIGRQEAHELIYQVSQKAYVNGQSLNQALKDTPKIVKRFTSKEIDELLTPSTYTGLSGFFVDRILAN